MSAKNSINQPNRGAALPPSPEGLGFRAVNMMMKVIKSERLRKLESELQDLQQWLELGLVPKKDLEKHKEEIQALQAKINEEKERLQFLKEGDEEEFVVPKRSSGKPGYSDMPTIPDIDVSESASGATESGFDMETYISDDATLSEGRDESQQDAEEVYSEEKANAPGEDEEENEEDESYFSDRNRWKRGGIVDPDADEW